MMYYKVKGYKGSYGGLRLRAYKTLWFKLERREVHVLVPILRKQVKLLNSLFIFQHAPRAACMENDAR